MSKQRQPTPDQAHNSPAAHADQANIELLEEMDAPSLAVDATAPAQGQEKLLTRLHTPQRQAAIRRASQIGGNRLAQRMAPQVRTAAPSSLRSSPALQRATQPDAAQEEGVALPEADVRRGFATPPPDDLTGRTGIASTRLLPASAAYLQAKLTVNTPDDQYEQEADHVADQVMRATDAGSSPSISAGVAPSGTSDQGDDAAVPLVTPAVEQRIDSLRGGGSPLPDGERTFFEDRFGQDFGDVRLHTTSEAAHLSHDLSAQAFTVGNNVAFGAGAYQPGTSEGRRLLAHELTHVVQQGGAVARKTVQRKETNDELPIEEAIGQAEEQVDEAAVAQEQAEPVDAQPVDLPENTAAAGADGGGGGGAAAPAPAGAASAPAPADQAAGNEMAAPEEAIPAGQEAGPAVGADAANTEGGAEAANATAGAATPAAANAASSPEAVATPDPATPAAANAVALSPEAAVQAPAAPSAAAQTVDQNTAVLPSQEQPAVTQTQADQTASEQAAFPEHAAQEQGDAPSAEQEAVQTEAAPDATQQSESEAAAKPDEDDERRHVQRMPANGVIQRTPAIAPKSPNADPAFQAVVQHVKGVAKGQKAHPPASQKAAEAAAAAKMPAEEKQGKAQGQQASDVTSAAAAQEAKAAAGQAPGFNKAAFVASVKAKIDQLTPKDPKDMENIEGSGVFGNVKGAVDGQVQSGKQAAQGNVDDKVKQAPNPGQVADKPVAPLQPNEPGGAPPSVDGAGAAPKAKGAAEVEAPLQAGSQQLDAKMAQANISEEQLQKSNEPSFQGALKAKTDAQIHAQTAPQAYRTNERGTVAGAEGEATAQTQTGTVAMHEGRVQVSGEMNNLQSTAKGADEGKRADIGKAIDGIYTSAKGEVEGILNALDGQVDQAFNQGAEAAKNKATDYIKRETKSYKDKRYNKDKDWTDIGAHISGALTHLSDAVTEMPPEYFEIFKAGRDLYTSEMEVVLGRVADIVADHLGRAKQRIEQGRQQIADFVAKQPAELREVAQQAASEAGGKFEQLEQTVDSKQEELVDKLAQSYVSKLQELDSALEQMKEEDKGLLQKAGDAIGGVIKTIEELASLLTNTLQRAAAAIPLILKDPIQFLGNLISGIGQGLKAFASNIGTHLQQGLIGWLTGAIGSAGIQLPASFDLPGIFSLVMQLLGLTWQSIRAKIVQGLGDNGERIVGALEQAWEVFQIIRTQGLMGLWNFIKDMVGDLKAMVIDQIKSMVSEQVIKAGIDWLIGILGGPAGAFVKAAQGIIRVVTWFMDNGKRVMSLVNSIIESVVAIANGDIGGAARFIEGSLAKALPTVISFLADLLGLGGISKKIQEIIKKVQEPINKAIQWLVQKAKALAKKVMGMLRGGKNSQQKDQAGTTKAPVGEIGEKVTFSAAGEGHRLWVDVQGSHAKLMVASKPQTVEEQLAEFGRVLTASDNDNDDVKKKKQQARQLLQQVPSLNEGANQKANQLAEMKANGGADNTQLVEQMKNELVQKQHALSSLLQQIFLLCEGIFGESENWPEGSKLHIPLPKGTSVVVASNNKPGNFKLRPGVDDRSLGFVRSSGKSTSISIEPNSNNIDAEYQKIFNDPNRKPTRNDLMSKTNAEDIRAAGFEVVYAPTRSNEMHTRIISGNNTFDDEGREWLSAAFGETIKGKNKKPTSD